MRWYIEAVSQASFIMVDLIFLLVGQVDDSTPCAGHTSANNLTPFCFLYLTEEKAIEVMREYLGPSLLAMPFRSRPTFRFKCKTNPIFCNALVDTMMNLSERCESYNWW